MIGKKTPNPKKSSSKSRRVVGLTNYITAPENENSLEKCVHFEAVNFLTDDLQSQQIEMIALSTTAVRSKDPIDHYVLSWQEGETPTIEQAREAVQMTMKHLGLEGHQVIWGLHDDTENVHIHIAVNRVHPETLKVVEINKGFQNNAIQQAAAIVEKLQGWKNHEKARFKTDEFGNLITDAKNKRPQIFKEADKPKEPTGKVKDKEIQTGEKSAQRIGIEKAAPIIAAAMSWADLHAKMQAAGMEYRRDGSGAKIFIGDVGVKASDIVDRKNNFGALQKRFGLYQPPNQPEIKNDPHNRTQIISDERFSTGYDQPHTAPTRLGTFNTLRDLSSSNLDVTAHSKQKKSKSENLLQSHESSDNRGTGRVRRRSHSSGPERSAASKSRQPLKDKQPGWNEYIAIRDAQKFEKTQETLALQKRHGAERTTLYEKLKAERTQAMKGNWSGKGAAKNQKKSDLATLQAAEKLELSEKHRDERKALQARYKSLPIYKQWKEQPKIVGLLVLPIIEQQNIRQKQISVAKTLRSLTSKVDARQHTTYQLNSKDVFRDEGRTITVLDLKSDAGIAAALAVAQQKFGNVLELTGSDEFKKNAVAVAVDNGLTCRFTDPELDKLRAELQQQKYQAERDAERAKAPEQPPAPAISPSNTPGPQAPAPRPQTANRAELARAAKKAAREAVWEAEAKAERDAAAQKEIPDAGSQTLDTEPAPEAQQQEELGFNWLVTDRERELVQRINAALKADNGKDLQSCMDSLGGLRSEAQKALAAVSPQEVNQAAIAHQVKQEQNEAAKKRGDPEPWHMTGIGSKTGACSWDKRAADAAAERDAHSKKPRPAGMFKGAETKAWDERSAELATKATSWEKAADGIKRELSLTTEKRVSKEAEGVAASNAKNAPQHAKQQARAGAIAEVQKRLETALKSHRERQQERDSSKGWGR